MLKRRLWQIECVNDIIVHGCIYSDEKVPFLIENGIGLCPKANKALGPNNQLYESDLELLNPDQEMYGMCIINKGPGGRKRSTDWCPLTLSEVKGFFTAVLTGIPDFDKYYDSLFDDPDSWVDEEKICTPTFDCMIAVMGSAESLSV